MGPSTTPHSMARHVADVQVIHGSSRRRFVSSSSTLFVPPLGIRQFDVDTAGKTFYSSPRRACEVELKTIRLQWHVVLSVKMARIIQLLQLVSSRLLADPACFMLLWILFACQLIR